MICIIRHDAEGEIDGWIIALDVDDARRQATAIGAHDLASHLYGMFDLPPPGKHKVGPYTVLVN